jgi:hypothetical protein
MHTTTHAKNIHRRGRHVSKHSFNIPGLVRLGLSTSAFTLPAITAVSPLVLLVYLFRSLPAFFIFGGAIISTLFLLEKGPGTRCRASCVYLLVMCVLLVLFVVLLGLSLFVLLAYPGIFHWLCLCVIFSFICHNVHLYFSFYNFPGLPMLLLSSLHLVTARFLSFPNMSYVHCNSATPCQHEI